MNHRLFRLRTRVCSLNYLCVNFDNAWAEHYPYSSRSDAISLYLMVCHSSMYLFRFMVSHDDIIAAACNCMTSPSYFASLAVCLLIIELQRYADNQISCHRISMKFQIFTVCTEFHTLSHLTIATAFQLCARSTVTSS